MKRSSGVRLCATAAASALSLALVTGCSGGGSKDSEGGAGDKPAAKVLSAAELAELIVTEGDVPGYKVKLVTGGTPVRSKVKSADARCDPLLRVMTGLAPADARAETNRMVQEVGKRPADAATSPDDLTDGKFEDAIKDSMDVDSTVVALSSYDGDGAEQALRTVSDAVRACAGGFRGDQAGTEATFTKVTEERPAGAGDASVAFAADSDTGDGDSAPVHVVVARHGNTVASYTTINLGAMMSGKAYAVPAAVIKAQAAKLT